jgi:hypothetical protein
LSRRLKRYYGRLRRPPGTRSTSRLSTGYRTRRSGDTNTHAGHRAGEGLPSSRRHPLNVPSPHTPGGSSGPQSRLYTPSMAFAVTGAARLLLFPPAGGVLTTRQTSLNASDRSVAPPTGLSTLRFDPRAFPPEAGSLLPGLLTATRTGPSPAGDDELMLDQLPKHHLQLWAHPGLDEIQVSAGARSGPPRRSRSCRWLSGKGSLSRVRRGPARLLGGGTMTPGPG